MDFNFKGAINRFYHRVNIYRRFLHWSKQGVIFIHVPKAAGTSINKAIYGRTLGHYTINEIERAFPRLVEKSFVFTICRNPYDRLVSAYHFAKAGRTKDMGMRNPKQYQIPEFDTFHSFVTEWLENKDITLLDNVFRPQYLYVSSNGKLNVDFLGHVETLAKDMEIVSQKLGKTIHVGHSNAVVREKSFRDYYTPELQRIVMDLYEKDFRLLGYSFEI